MAVLEVLYFVRRRYEVLGSGHATSSCATGQGTENERLGRGKMESRDGWYFRKATTKELLASTCDTLLTHKKVERPRPAAEGGIELLPAPDLPFCFVHHVNPFVLCGLLRDRCDFNLRWTKAA